MLRKVHFVTTFPNVQKRAVMYKEGFQFWPDLIE